MRLLLLLSCLGVTALAADPAPSPVYLDNRPLGTAAAPLILRAFMPDPGLDPAVFAHHNLSAKTSEYSPEKGQDLPGDVKPIPGLVAAIGVNHGPALSYVFDTTECRLMYAWQDGFLDMFPLWGDRSTRGSMLHRDYVPRLIGTLFYRTAGPHPLTIDGKSVSALGAPRFLGYDLVRGQPVFIARHGDQVVRTRVQPAGALALQVEFTTERPATLAFRSGDDRVAVRQQQEGPTTLKVTLGGQSLQHFEGYSRKPAYDKASALAGAEIAQNFGCIVCHSSDGAKSIGPTWLDSYGRRRELADGTVVDINDAYIIESIREPNEKIAKGFARSLMPAYAQFQEVELQSLILYIRSLGKPE